MILKTSKKIFAHVDCDSFFASWEVLKNPKLKNKFVCVWWEIIVACTYNAKTLGIKTWTPIWEAKRILKDKWVFLLPDMWYYQDISYKLMDFLRYNTLNTEEFSIDEAFCEITWIAELNKISLEKYIINMQENILKQIWIPVSIWVSNTRIKAKIFSKINKPFWNYISLNHDKNIFSKLPISIIPYIWKSYQNKLQYKAKTVYDFIQIWYPKLKELIWKNATDLWLELSWVNAFVVKKSKQIKSMSRWRSFNKQITNNKDFLYSQLLLNFNNLYEELTIKNFETKKVSIFFRDKEKMTSLFHFNLSSYISTREELLKYMQELFNKFYDSWNLYRSTGIIFSKLKKTEFHQTSIFEKTNILENNNTNLIKVINAINSKFDRHKISFWSDLLNKNFDSKLWIRK